MYMRRITIGATQDMDTPPPSTQAATTTSHTPTASADGAITASITTTTGRTTAPCTAVTATILDTTIHPDGHDTTLLQSGQSIQHTAAMVDITGRNNDQ